jgi:gamma-glutamyltranspeptidase
MFVHKKVILLPSLAFLTGILVLSRQAASQSAPKTATQREFYQAWPKQAVRSVHAMVVTDEELASQAGVGLVNAIGNDRQSGERLGAADPRDRGSAMGY